MSGPDFGVQSQAPGRPVPSSTRRSLTIDRDDLAAATAAAGLTANDADRLWAALSARTASQPRFDGVHVAYYLGALLVIGAMGWFMTLAWDAVGGLGLTMLALVYAAAFWPAGETLWAKGQTTPGGLLFTIAVCMTPLAVYGVQDALGLWPQEDPGVYREYYTRVRGSWIVLEIATIAAGAIAVWRRPFAFLTAPIAFALWFMSMDLAPLLFGRVGFSWDDREWLSVWFGVAMLLTSYLLDLRHKLRQDFAFWGYLFGLMAFWGGLSVMDSGSELSKFLYCLINVALIVLSVLLRQRSFVVFGALGVLGYLGHLSYRVFEDSLLFPIALTFLGVAIIYAGVLYQRNAEAIAASLHESLPESVRNLIPPRAR